MLHSHTEISPDTPTPLNDAREEWTIREIAAEYDVTPRTLRFYEDKGLLSPRRENSSRFFTPKDRRRLEHILRAKRLGFALDDIADFQAVIEGRVLDRTELMKRQKAYLRMAESLKRRRDDIDIVSDGLKRTAKRIQTYVNDPARDAAVFSHVEAYAAALSRHMDDDQI